MLRFIDEERPGLIGANEAQILGYYLGVGGVFDPSYWSVRVFHGRAMRPPPDHYRLYENRLLYHCEKEDFLRKKWQLVFPRQVSKAVNTWKIIAKNYLSFHLPKELIGLIANEIEASRYDHHSWGWAYLTKQKNKRPRYDVYFFLN